VIFNFGNGAAGGTLVVPLIEGTNGYFYGISEAAGAYCWYCGTVFRATAGGEVTVLHSFDNTDGRGCFATNANSGGLIQATDGNLYGTTCWGGAYGNGTVFRIGPDGGDFTTLHNLGGADGSGPGELIEAADGSFYGTTGGGGTNNSGTIFHCKPNGDYTVIYSFTGLDGAQPTILTQVDGGGLYGTTVNGGSHGDGTIFKITYDGELTTLYNFDGAHGANPFSGLYYAPDGYFYGAAGADGPHGYGTVFRMTLDGALTVLHSFEDSDGYYPSGRLIQASDGNLYGTTAAGGTYGDGVLYEIGPGGSFTLLHDMSPDTPEPWAGLLQATDGSFYGVTWAGNAFTASYGTLFRLSLGLGPFVKTLPHAGSPGTRVTITGGNLSGATSVTFGGTPSLFTIMSATEIVTTVPAGANTGVVEVALPTATLKSSGSFHVFH
jgi:uncharacterized repeat protein (TIGR03803 family)